MVYSMQAEGFLIVLKPVPMLERYAECCAANGAEALREFREAFSMFDVTRYRGIARSPLSPFPSLDAQVIEQFEASGCDMKSNSRARRRFCEILERHQYAEDDDSDLLPTLRDANEVIGLTDEPSIWEVIHLSRGDAVGVGRVLGYDIGYWGGDHYSLIADSIVTPTWHGPPEEDYAELAAAMVDLNENILFPNADAAAAFRTYYKSKPWAEKEGEDGADFSMIKVSVGCETDC